jgi:hypothetical protein
MTGKSKVVNTHSHICYPVRPKIPLQRYHGNGYNNTHIHAFILSPKTQNPLTGNYHQPTLDYYIDR